MLWDISIAVQLRRHLQSPDHLLYTIVQKITRQIFYKKQLNFRTGLGQLLVWTVARYD